MEQVGLEPNLPECKSSALSIYATSPLMISIVDRTRTCILCIPNAVPHPLGYYYVIVGWLYISFYVHYYTYISRKNPASYLNSYIMFIAESSVLETHTFYCTHPLAEGIATSAIYSPYCSYQISNLYNLFDL